MGHTPYGYRIENGMAVINPDEAGHVRQIFHNYIEGMSLSEAAKAAGHPMVHSMVRRMLSRECYLGESKSSKQQSRTTAKNSSCNSNHNAKNTRNQPASHKDKN